MSDNTKSAHEAAKPTPDDTSSNIGSLRHSGLLSPNLVSRPGIVSLTVAVDSGFLRMAMKALAGQTMEQGGVALTARSENTLLILGAVFPGQEVRSPSYCEFSAIEVDRVRRALDQVAYELSIRDGDVKMTWVHTHPHLGVFLSPIDHRTAREWRELDPDFTPIVIDASKKDLDEQIGVFDATGKQIRPMCVIDGLVSELAVTRLNQAIFQTYRADRLPEPLVLISGLAP